MKSISHSRPNTHETTSGPPSPPANACVLRRCPIPSTSHQLPPPHSSRLSSLPIPRKRPFLVPVQTVHSNPALGYVLPTNRETIAGFVLARWSGDVDMDAAEDVEAAEEIPGKRVKAEITVVE